MWPRPHLLPNIILCVHCAVPWSTSAENLCVSVCVCMYVCLYVSLYVRVFVCTCISMYVCLYVCLYVRLFVCTCSNSPVRSPCTVNMVYFTVASAALYSWQAFSDTSVDVTWSCDISLNSEEWSITELYTKCNTRLILSTLLYNK